MQKGFDVFNALDLMENKTFLEKLKFGIGDGNLQYYLYNWKCPSMAPEKVSALGWWGPPARPVHGKGSCLHNPQGDEFAVTHTLVFPVQPLSGAVLHTVTGESSDGSSVLSPLCLHRGCPWGKALATCFPRLILLLD